MWHGTADSQRPFGFFTSLFFVLVAAAALTMCCATAAAARWDEDSEMIRSAPFVANGIYWNSASEYERRFHFRPYTTPLMIAAMQGNMRGAESLLEGGAQVNAQDEEGNTALIFAAKAGHADMVDLFLSRGADMRMRDAYGRTPLMFAAMQGHYEVVRMLLRAGADPFTRDGMGVTAFHYAISYDQRAIALLLTPQWCCTPFSWWRPW